MDVATLGIRVEFKNGGVVLSSLKDLEVAGTKVEAAATRMNRRLGLAEIEARKLDTALDAVGGSSFRLTGGLGGLAGALQAVAGALFVREVLGLADAYTGLHARLGLVTTDLANLARVEGELFAISQSTRTGLESNVELYAALARSTKSLGLSQSDLLQVTKTVAESFVISGASASETNSAVRQLSQAFASGVLRGDEFNSIAENAPRLQQAVAASLHVTIGELRAMAEQGKLTGGVIAKALLDQSREIEAEFDKMPTTVAGAMTRIHNSILVAVGGINSAQGSTAGLATALTSLADAIPGIGQTLNAFFGGISLLALDAAIGVEKLVIGVGNLQTKAAGALMTNPATAGLGQWLAEGSGNILAGRRDNLAAMEADRAQQEARITALTAPGTLNAGGTPTATGPTKAEQIAAEKEFQRLLRERIAVLNHAVQEQKRMYREGTAEAIRGLHEIEAEEDRQTAFAIQQYNEQTRAAQAAYKEEGDAAARVVKEQEKYHDDMRKIGLQSLDQLLTGGLRSWAAFFDSVFGLFRRLMARMEAEGKDSGALYKALGVAGIAIGGGMAGYNAGSSTTNRGSGALFGTASGAAAGAAMGSIVPGIGTAIGAVIGGATGFIGAMFGTASASRQAAKQMADAQATLKISMQGLKAIVSGDQLGVAIAQIEAEREQKRREYEDAYAGGKNEAERYRLINQMNALESKRIQLLKDEYAIQQVRTYEDLRVRLLVAQGHDKEAAAMRLELAQQRERADLVKSFGDEVDATELATLALLDQVQAQEKLKGATDAANQSALNMVQGYKYQAAFFRAMTPRGAQFGGPGSSPTSSASGDLAVTVMLPNGEVLGKTVIKDFARRQRLGDSELRTVLS